MSREDVKIILELSQDDFESEDFKNAYHAGYLKSKFLVQKSIVNLANNGSSPAQTIANKLITNVEQDSILNG